MGVRLFRTDYPLLTASAGGSATSFGAVISEGELSETALPETLSFGLEGLSFFAKYISFTLFDLIAFSCL